MDNLSTAIPIVIKVLRWIARIISLLFVLTTLFFMVGEGFFEHLPPIIMILMGVLMIGGLVLAWKWEFIGALTSLVGFIGVSVLNPGALTKPLMYIVPGTAILFLLCWRMSGPARPVATNTSETKT